MVVIVDYTGMQLHGEYMLPSILDLLSGRFDQPMMNYLVGSIERLD